MRRFKVNVDIMQNGKLKSKDIITCDVNGKDLNEETIIKRLTNNIKTWQSAYNKCEIYKCKFIITGYEEV